MRKPAFCICENKDADQRLCFRYTDSSIPQLPKYEITSSVTVQPGLCRTWSETPKTGFLTTRLILYRYMYVYESIILGCTFIRILLLVFTIFVLISWIQVLIIIIKKQQKKKYM